MKMRRKIVMSVFVGLWVLGLVCTAHGYGQGLVGDAADFGKLVEDKKQEINGWENKATLLIALTIIVGTLGVATGVFQRFKKKWSTVATVMAGALISIITIANNTVFEVDHRTLSCCAQQARQIVGEIELEIIRYQSIDTEEGRLMCIEEIRNHLHRINEISAKVYRPQTAMNNRASQFHLYAQELSQEPSWIVRPPTDEVNLYFLGVGASGSLKKAKEYALQDAADKAVAFFVDHFEKTTTDRRRELDLEALSEYLVRSGKASNSYFKYDRNKNSYLYYTLLEINKRNTQVDIKLFAVQKRVPLPRGLAETLATIQQKSIHYHLFKNSIYDDKKAEQLKKKQ
jgi:hypothetical protein